MSEILNADTVAAVRDVVGESPAFVSDAQHRKLLRDLCDSHEALRAQSFMRWMRQRNARHEILRWRAEVRTLRAALHNAEQERDEAIEDSRQQALIVARLGEQVDAAEARVAALEAERDEAVQLVADGLNSALPPSEWNARARVLLAEEARRALVGEFPHNPGGEVKP